MPSTSDRDISIGCVGGKSSRGLLRGVGKVTGACNSAWQSFSQTVKGHDGGDQSSPKCRGSSRHEAVRVSSRSHAASFPPTLPKSQTAASNLKGSKSAPNHTRDVVISGRDQRSRTVWQASDVDFSSTSHTSYDGKSKGHFSSWENVSATTQTCNVQRAARDQEQSLLTKKCSTVSVSDVSFWARDQRHSSTAGSGLACAPLKHQGLPSSAVHALSRTKSSSTYTGKGKRSFSCNLDLEEFLRPPSTPTSSSSSPSSHGYEDNLAGNWNVLPSDILHTILSMIPSASARAVVRSVCHSWRLCIDVCTMKLRPRGVVNAKSIARWPIHYSNISTLDLAHCVVNSNATQAFRELLAAEASFPMLTSLTLPVCWLPSTNAPYHQLDILTLPVLRRLRIVHLYGSTHGGVAHVSAGHSHGRTAPATPTQPPSVGLPSYSYRERRQHPSPRLQRLAIRNAHLDYTSCADLISGLAAVVPSLPTLLLPSNGIDVLPCSLSRLTALQTLDISGNQLFWWQNVLHSLTTLRTLDISNNPLNAWPDGVSSLTSLTSLSARSGGFQTIGPSLAELTNLKHLDLSSNPLGPSIPDPILALKSLDQLDLQSCSMSKVHTSITSLVNLQHLNVSHNRIAIFDVPLTEFPRLEYLNLSSNRLQQLRSSLPNQPEAPNAWDVFSEGIPPSNLRHLDVSSNRLEVFPMIVLQLTQLETLLMDDQKGWQWYNTLPLAANGGSIRQEIYRRCPNLRTYTDA